MDDYKQMQTMTYTITYKSSGIPSLPFQANIKINADNFACGYGKTADEAKADVIERVKFKTMQMPPEETIEI
jgi:hypothetical protein